MNLIVTAATHPKHQENVNQDAVIAKKTKTVDGKDVFFAVVCDGMGKKGQVAAISVAKGVDTWFEAFRKTKNADISQEAIFKTWDIILKKLTRRLYSGLEDDESCATAAIFLIIENIWYMANIGDVRVYEIDQEGAKQLSTDHTYAEREIALGHMDPLEAMTDPQAFCVLQTIGKTKDMILSKASGSVTENAVYLICTDGFYRKNRKSVLYKNFRPDVMEEGCEAEVLHKTEENALESGETDDMSAVIVRIAKTEVSEKNDFEKRGKQ